MAHNPADTTEGNGVEQPPIQSPSHSLSQTQSPRTRSELSTHASPPHHLQHPHPHHPPTSYGKCHCLCWIIHTIYVIIRAICCCFGCFCGGFLFLLLYTLILISEKFGDVDFASTSDTCYHTLNVTPDATLKEIQKSFRKLALKYHPDKTTPANQAEYEKIFQEISHCYDILSNEKSRKRYDASGYKENEYGVPFDTEININDIFNFFSKMYEEQEGEDDEGEDNQNDHGFHFKFKRRDGDDRNREKKRKTKTDDGKKRKTKTKTKRKLKDYTINLKLEDIVVDEMHSVNIKNKKYNIEIPRGVPNDYVIEDELNGYNWNIKVNEWDEYKLWNRKNNDESLYSYVSISIEDILMGYDMEISMIDGKSMTFNMDEHSCGNGKMFEIKNHGLPFFNSKRKKRGSAFVECDILYPKLSKKQKNALEEFMKKSGEWKYDEKSHDEL